MSEYQDLANAIQTGAPKRQVVAVACQNSFGGLNGWIHSSAVDHSAQGSSILLQSALSASVEVVSLAYLGLMRPSISSLRTYYELSLAWLYYKDHPIEWLNVEYGSGQVSLPGEIQKYLRSNFAQYDSRWATLRKAKSFGLDDPYKIMSGFVHGGVMSTLPNTKLPSQIVFTDAVLSQLPDFIDGVCEYVTDAYVAAHQHNWESLRADIRSI